MDKSYSRTYLYVKWLESEEWVLALYSPLVPTLADLVEHDYCKKSASDIDPHPSGRLLYCSRRSLSLRLYGVALKLATAAVIGHYAESRAPHVLRLKLRR